MESKTAKEILSLDSAVHPDGYGSFMVSYDLAIQKMREYAEQQNKELVEKVSKEIDDIIERNSFDESYVNGLLKAQQTLNENGSKI